MTALSSVIGRGVLASRPAAGTPGALYFATDQGNWGQMFRDNGSSWDLVDTPALDMVRATNSVAQSIPSQSGAGYANMTALTFDTNDTLFTTNTAMHSTSSNTSRFIAQIAGRYSFKCHLQWNGGGTATYRTISIYKNATTFITDLYDSSFTTVDYSRIVSADIYLAAADYIEAMLQQTSGGSMNVQNQQFSLVRIG